MVKVIFNVVTLEHLSSCCLLWMSGQVARVLIELNVSVSAAPARLISLFEFGFGTNWLHF